MSMYLEEHSSIHLFDETHSQSLFYYDQHPNLIEHETTIDSSNFSSAHQSTDKDQEENLCQICGDTASGWHCGAITCEACKKFFLRSVSTKSNLKKKYQCEKDYRCVITKRSRTQCQYCRFAKCLDVGMKTSENVERKSEDLYKKLPCLVCGASASGIHFGAVTCEACKGFFRRSIRENAPERYHCANKNHCEIFSSSSSTKTSCRSCRFEKCLRIGMSIDASRIGRQSNLFKESIRQIQNNSMTMATINDSARVASMAKKRKMKSKHQKNTSIHLEMPRSINDFIELIYHSYLKYFQVFPPCFEYENIWLTISTQLIHYAQLFLDFCQTILPDFIHFNDKHEIISSSIHSIVMINLFTENYFENQRKNYWRAEKNLIFEIYQYFPQFQYFENLFYQLENKFQNFRFDGKEFSLLIFMIITRTNLSTFHGHQQQQWADLQLKSVQSLYQYSQIRRANLSEDSTLEFYEIVFFVSQLRSMNRHFVQYFQQLPWPSMPHLPSFFYRIFLPSIINSNSFHDNSSLYPI